MTINKDWHLKNKMPKNPTFDQRVKWHSEHSRNCLCRKMPPDLEKVVRDYEKKN